MRTKNLTLNCTYKIKLNNNIEFNEACRKLKTKIENMFNSDEFDNYMCIITKEVTVMIENVNEPQAELFITMFTTMVKPAESPTRLLRKYMEDNLLNISDEDYTARIVKRRIY